VLAAATHAPRAGSCKELAGWRSSYGRLYLVRLFYKLYFWLHFHYKNGDCIENDYHAVSGPSGASDCRDSFLSRCRISVANAACSDGPHSSFSLGANRGQTCSTCARTRLSTHSLTPCLSSCRRPIPEPEERIIAARCIVAQQYGHMYSATRDILAQL
jgi:hypothetical protein